MDRLFDQRRYLIPFRSTLLPQIFTDTLVIGAGVAGLRAAVAASEHGDVIVLSKGDLKSTNTAWAQGGIAAVLTTDDSTESHVQDTLVAGAGLCDHDAVRAIVEHGPRSLRQLMSWGMRLDTNAEGELAVGREGGHSASRIVHTDGDATGRELQRCLVEKVRNTTGVRLFENCFALDLITPGNEPGSPVMGAITYHPKHGLQMIWAKATILASGGAGVLFRETTNPAQATADGLAMAYRAGATVSDMAFLQFHPTTLYLPGAARWLITEAVRGEGAYLLDSSHYRFMLDVHPLAELAPRDVVSRAIVRQIAKQASAAGGGHVWLDCRHIKGFQQRFPGICALLKKFDLDPAEDLIPVHPAAHYMIGGVHTDLAGRSDVPGLYVVGEAASTGLHGANRLASNSLLEGLVMGEIAGHTCAEMKASSGTQTTRPSGWTTPARPAPVSVISDIRPSDQGELDLDDVRSSLRSAMWKNVGIERSGAKLRDVGDMLDFWARYTLDKIFDEPAGWEVQNMLLVGALVARSAAWRDESRGCHTRTDTTEAKPDYEVHDCWRRGRDNPDTVPVNKPPTTVIAGTGALV
ncbi:MAG: L-aspartate oxidase [Phycisphaerales bacterium]|nr:L-aspartate oxidase [Phycisphaerales bacterium]